MFDSRVWEGGPVLSGLSLAATVHAVLVTALALCRKRVCPYGGVLWPRISSQAGFRGVGGCFFRFWRGVSAFTAASKAVCSRIWTTTGAL